MSEEKSLIGQSLDKIDPLAQLSPASANKPASPKTVVIVKTIGISTLVILIFVLSAIYVDWYSRDQFMRLNSVNVALGKQVSGLVAELREQRLEIEHLKQVTQDNPEIQRTVDSFRKLKEDYLELSKKVVTLGAIAGIDTKMKEFDAKFSEQAKVLEAAQRDTGNLSRYLSDQLYPALTHLQEADREIQSRLASHEQTLGSLASYFRKPQQPSPTLQAIPRGTLIDSPPASQAPTGK